MVDNVEITTEEIATADAGYKPFPKFELWKSLNVDNAAWGDAVDRLGVERAGADEDQIARAVRSTMRMAAIDTGAIEGLYDVDPSFTYSVATEAATWELEMEERNADIRPLFESQLRGYELVLDVATQAMPVNEAWIRSLHAEITASQETYRVLTPQGWQEQRLKHGEYKEQPNHPWAADGTVKFSYAPVLDTKPEMERLVRELRSDLFEAAHPILQAAWAHYAFVRVHPFADGNGRVARALASVYLYRAASTPLLILADQKPRYLAGLRAADANNPQAFVSFVGERALSGLARFSEILVASEAPAVEDSLAALGRLHVAVGDMTYAELDARARAIRDVINEEVTRELEALKLPANVKGKVHHPTVKAPSDKAYRHPVGTGSLAILLDLRSEAPADAQATRGYQVGIRKAPSEKATYKIFSFEGPQDLLVDLNDVYPDVTAELRFRLRTMVHGAVASALAELLRSGRDRLREAGYLP